LVAPAVVMSGANPPARVSKPLLATWKLPAVNAPLLATVKLVKAMLELELPLMVVVPPDRPIVVRTELVVPILTLPLPVLPVPASTDALPPVLVPLAPLAVPPRTATLPPVPAVPVWLPPVKLVVAPVPLAALELPACIPKVVGLVSPAVVMSGANPPARVSKPLLATEKLPAVNAPLLATVKLVKAMLELELPLMVVV